MKASAFIAAIEQRHGVTLGLHRGRLHVLTTRGTRVVALPRTARMAIAAQRDSLIAYLAHVEDGELRVADPERFGLGRLENGEYTHPEGDHMVEEVLLDPERAERDARERETRRHHEAFALGAARPALPAPQPIVLKPGQYPGHFTFTLERGRRYR